MDKQPCCDCEECLRFKSEMVRLGEPLTWRGLRILTAHEAALAPFPYGPEPD